MKACSCGARSVYTRRYSGESFCSKCFREAIVEKTRRTISRYSMLTRGDTVGVAVSGGKDSLSLLNVLKEINDGCGWELVAISVDEGVRGYRDEAILHAKNLTNKLGIKHIVVSYEELFGFTLDNALDWKGERDISSCSFCGVFRRRAIDEAASKAGVEVIATAHNLDDYVQTFLMNMLHGDVSRLGWLHPSYSDKSFPVRRVKPFLELYEEEVALYAFLSKIPFQSVSCPYMHEGLRSEVRDFLNEMEAKHPGMKNVLFRSSLEIISRLGPPTKDSVIPCSLCGKPSSRGLCGVCRMKASVEQHVNYAEDKS